MKKAKSGFPVDLSDFIYAPDEGLNPGTGEDLSEKLKPLLDKSTVLQKGIYFPEGVYLFSADVLLKSYNSLKGSVNGTVFRGICATAHAVMFGDKTYNNTVTELSIDNIIFDNILINFYGHKTGISVGHNVFINTVTETGEAQLSCSTNPYIIKGNVFMRGRGFAGIGLNTYGNAQGLIIEQNFLGSVSDIDAAQPWLDEETQQMLTTLLELREAGVMAFDDAQGDFVAGWYSTSYLRKGVFRKNFFKGSGELYLFNPKTGQKDIARDHNVYIKKYDQVHVVQNYFAGWPDNDCPFGQLKFRNAKGLIFACNYLEGISFNARPYNDVEAEWWIMQDTFIFNNYLNGGMISYWQNFTDSKAQAISVKNYLVFSNRFINRNMSNEFVTSPANTLSPDQFLCAENLFDDTSEPVPKKGRIAEMSVETLRTMLPIDACHYLSIAPLMPPH